MVFFERDRLVLICWVVLMILTSAGPAIAVETGPVDRQWGLGWDHGLTGRYWFGGVWELALSGGPNDYLSDDEGHSLDSGYPPYWEERESYTTQNEKQESGFVRIQAGRLISRRGPLAAVGYLGLKYEWSHSSYIDNNVDVDTPEDSNVRGSENDSSSWTLTLGLRPSFEVMGFLTIETAFGLWYRWSDYERVEWREFQQTGRVTRDEYSDYGERFSYSGWSGMGSLQFIVWF